jgi:acetyl esterase/lipase
MPSPIVADPPAGAVDTRVLDDFLREIGPRWSTDIRQCSADVKAAYAPLLAAAPKDGIEVQRDIAYGALDRQVLDVFAARRAVLASGVSKQAARPVVVFVHGGGYVRGERSSDTGIYDNVLTWFARQGCVGVNVEYRLAPQSTFPGAVDDVATAMRWVHAHIEAHGGDPARVLLMGHSAGGTHVASYAFDPLLGHLGRHACAVVLVSARLAADVSPENPNADGVRAYFGDDPSMYAVRSPMAYAACSRIPVMVANAQYENPLLDLYGLEFAHRVAVARRCAPWYLSVRRHNHMSILAHFNTADEAFGREILDFFETATGARALAASA